MKPEERARIDGAIIAMRVDAMPKPEVDSFKSNCSVCNEEVWIANMMVKVAQRNQIGTAVCTMCVDKVILEKPDARIETIEANPNKDWNWA